MLRFFRRSDGTDGRPAATGFRPSPRVTASVHTDGVVFLDSARGILFSANRVGAAIWQGVRAGRTLEQISDAVSSDFQAPRDVVGRDTASFLAELLSAGILDRAVI